MSFSVSKFGDWAKAGIVLQGFSTKLTPAFKAQLEEDGNFVLEKIKEHIALQDLNWTPLSKNTIELKGGNTTIYVDTGYLRDNLTVRKVKAPANGVTFFIGASAWQTHKPSGRKFSELMIWLEYGTDKIPPRPIIRPTWDEVKPILQEHWSELLEDFVKKGGVGGV